MKKAKYVAYAVLAVAVLALLGTVKINVKFHVTPRDLAWSQAASSYAILPTTTGAGMNGKETIFPSTTVLQTVTTVAAGTLNGTTSAVYDISLPKDWARMVNISLNVTAVPGTSPSLTPTVKQSDDGGITFYKVFAQDGSSFSAITSTGAVTGKDFPCYGDLMEISYAASGTGNFTFTVSAAQAN